MLDLISQMACGVQHIAVDSCFHTIACATHHSIVLDAHCEQLFQEVSMKGSKGGFGKGKGSKKGFVAGPAVMTGKKGMK